MKSILILILTIYIQLVVITPLVFANGKATDAVSDQVRCKVCGMFVAKYPNWLAKIHYVDPTQVNFFDGVKDMMVFYFNPERYDGAPRAAIKDLFVKDYYSLTWLSAIDALYVIGSDVYGPMGHELIPFRSKEAAESFLQDHHGTEIITFGEITPELIDSLRAGQKMR